MCNYLASRVKSRVLARFGVRLRARPDRERSTEAEYRRQQKQTRQIQILFHCLTTEYCGDFVHLLISHCSLDSTAMRTNDCFRYSTCNIFKRIISSDKKHIIDKNREAPPSNSNATMG